MTMSSSYAFGPAELISGALSLPPFSLVIAMIIAGGIAIFAARPGRTAASSLDGPATAPRYLPEHRTLGVVSVGVIVVFLAELVLRGSTLAPGAPVAWWQFAVPVFCAAVGLGALFVVIVTRGTTPPEAPVVPTHRRSWSSFSSPTALIVAGFVSLVLVATTVAAGLASSPNGEGHHVWLVIPVPNEASIDPLRVVFYGWTFGVPVLAGLAVLLVAAWGTLDRNAARPYLRPETVTAERAARAATARGTTRIATAAVLLTTASAWRLIADAGNVSTLTILGENGGGPYEAAWRYAELAVVAGWLAPLLELTAFALLLLVAGHGFRRRQTSPTVAAAPVSAEAVR